MKKRRVRRNMKAINLTPKWSGLVPYFCRLLEDPSVPTSTKDTIKAELKRLAEFADKVNASAKGK